MYLIIKTKKSVIAENVELATDVIMQGFSKKYIGNIKEVVRDIEDCCLKDYNHSHNGIVKGKLFIPAVDFNTITIYFTDSKISPLTLKMNANNEYILYNDNGSQIDDFVPYGYIIKDIPCEDKDIYNDDETFLD